MSSKTVIYNGNIYSVIKEFLSGNGTYDINMLILSDTKGETFIVPEIDVTEYGREKTA
jgi:hypothetical protein